MFFLTWGVALPSPTRDLDLMGFITPDTTVLTRVFSEIIAVPVDEDGLTFLPESVVAEQIKDEDLYAGVRIRIRTLLGSMRIALQIDVGIGDSLIPEPVAATFPALIGDEAPVMRSYARELVVAEKFDAMVKLGEQSSRMKDFFDVWYLATHFDFDANSLRDAVAHTFHRRGTRLPKERPLPMTEVFLRSSAKQVQWSAFVTKSGLGEIAPSLEEAGEILWRFLGPSIRTMKHEALVFGWSPATGWNQDKSRS